MVCSPCLLIALVSIGLGIFLIIWGLFFLNRGIKQFFINKRSRYDSMRSVYMNFIFHLIFGILSLMCGIYLLYRGCGSLSHKFNNFLNLIYHNDFTMIYFTQCRKCNLLALVPLKFLCIGHGKVSSAGLIEDNNNSHFFSRLQIKIEMNATIIQYYKM